LFVSNSISSLTPKVSTFFVFFLDVCSFLEYHIAVTLGFLYLLPLKIGFDYDWCFVTQANPSDPKTFPFMLLGNKIDIDGGNSRVVSHCYCAYKFLHLFHKSLIIFYTGFWEESKGLVYFKREYSLLWDICKRGLQYWRCIPMYCQGCFSQGERPRHVRFSLFACWCLYTLSHEMWF
jgi:hypothetical protein